MSQSRSQQSASPSNDGLDRSIRRGTRWVFVAQIASQLVSFAVLAALYRLVTPEEFGLIGMVVPLLLLAKIFASFGLNVATVQQRSLTDGQLSTVFWANCVVGACAAVAVAACGPVAAIIYKTPQLVPLVAALAGTLLLAAVGAQHQALLERKLQIGRLMAARLVAQTVGGVAAVAAAVAGWGVWALVVQQYVELAALVLLVWQIESWRPCRWSRGDRARDLLAFGGFYSLSSLLFYVAQNADKILIAALLGGTRTGQAALGHYTQAFNLMMKPVYLVTAPITGVMLPALSRVKDDREQLELLVVRFYRMVAIVLFPSGVGLTLVAMDVMFVLGGTAWKPAGILLMALAPTILVQGLVNISGSVFAATGHARSLAVGACCSAGVMCTAVLTGLWVGDRWGAAPEGPTLGVACCYSLATVLVFGGPYLLFCFHTAGVSARVVLRELLWPAINAALMGLVVWAIATGLKMLEMPTVPRLALVIAVGVAVYGLLAWRELRWFVTQMREIER